MGKPVSFVRLLLPSFFILELFEFLLLSVASPSFLFSSERRMYVILFFLWSGMIGSPIVAMLIYGSLKKRRSRQ